MPVAQDVSTREAHQMDLTAPGALMKAFKRSKAAIQTGCDNASGGWVGYSLRRGGELRPGAIARSLRAGTGDRLPVGPRIRLVR
jgi:hypothetical protein